MIVAQRPFYTGTERTILPCLVRATITRLYWGDGSLITKENGINTPLSGKRECLVVFAPYRF